LVKPQRPAGCDMICFCARKPSAYRRVSWGSTAKLRPSKSRRPLRESFNKALKQFHICHVAATREPSRSVRAYPFSQRGKGFMASRIVLVLWRTELRIPAGQSMERAHCSGSLASESKDVPPSVIGQSRCSPPNAVVD